MLLNSEMRPREKSLGLAYLMLIGGHLGVHRFYLKRTATAIVQLVLFLIAALGYIVMLVTTAGFEETEATAGLFVGLILFFVAAAPLFVWVVIDLFLIPGMVRGINAQLEQEIMHQLEWLRNHPQAARGNDGGQPQGAPSQPYLPQPPYPQG
ncbi:TM2 domain-containing protein [Paenibacillus wenxiniae]|uniref:TM2 domain-containing protein n=1 Tax=Paenibacillus wenxiniae TaxID=1636843 RepID=A0ABW4RMJ6_9BACL